MCNVYDEIYYCEEKGVMVSRKIVVNSGRLSCLII